ESKEKSSVEEHPKLELKELPSHLEYAFLEDSNKLPVIVAKNLKVDEREALINVLKSYKRAIAWKISDIKGIDPRVDVIDIACKKSVQDVLDFQYNPKSSSPTLVSDYLISESDSCKEPIVESPSPTLTPFEESDFFLEEIEDFLNDDSIPTGIENSVYDPDGDILFLEKLLNEDPFQLPPMDLKLA
nr:reverse transcriptase domain-containing protein [Tanacetum cinerariifolium]